MGVEVQELLRETHTHLHKNKQCLTQIYTEKAKRLSSRHCTRAGRAMANSGAHGTCGGREPAAPVGRPGHPPNPVQAHLAALHRNQVSCVVREELSTSHMGHYRAYSEVVGISQFREQPAPGHGEWGFPGLVPLRWPLTSPSSVQVQTSSGAPHLGQGRLLRDAPRLAARIGRVWGWGWTWLALAVAEWWFTRPVPFLLSALPRSPVALHEQTEQNTAPQSLPPSLLLTSSLSSSSSSSSSF